MMSARRYWLFGIVVSILVAIAVGIEFVSAPVGLAVYSIHVLLVDIRLYLQTLCEKEKQND